ncbi:ATP-binding protein [Agreia pratensis]|uniref:AAA ATPase domain-containing protein n=1 Tax=Agreia pratensis TaxID=150121 RepID=A0A1X7KTB9_9MICO|nr:AAA family ATPase [Agreia pratensis]SMG44646.1 AAA ATPase domain-containing protein [Agreia pratensis]
MRETGLFGRERELAQLRAVLTRVSEGGSRSSGAVALLGGHSGVGKSALAQSAIAEAERLGFATHRIACEPFHEGMSFFPVRELVRQLCDGRPVAETIAVMFGTDSPQAEMAAVSDSVTADPASRREALVATFTNVIVGKFQSTDAQPLLLFIDDLEHLDVGSADALLCLISRISEGPVVILGAFRSDLVVSPSHPLKSITTSARRAEGVLTSVSVTGFSDSSIDDLVDVMLEGETELPLAFYEKLYRETEGNPLFIRELLRVLRDPATDGSAAQLVQVDGAWRFAGQVELWAIPPSVEDVIASRLDMLDPEQRSELEFAAVVGRRFAFEVLQKLTASGEDDLLLHLERYLSFELIRELRDDDESFEFSHGKIRDVLYESLSGLRKRRIHGQVALVLSAMVGTTNEDWDALIGEHLFLAAKLAEAFPYLLRAARNAQATGSAQDSVQLFTKALAASAGAVLLENDSRQSIQLELASALISANATEEAGTLLQQLVGEQVPSDIRATALNFLGDAQIFDGDIEQALMTYLDCERLAEKTDQSDMICEVSCDLAELHGRRYERLAGLEPAQAEKHRQQYVHYVDKALRFVPAGSTGPLRARVLRNKAKMSRVDGDLDAAVRLYSESIECVDGRVSHHRWLIPYAKTLRLTGNVDKALEIVARVSAWSAQVGSKRSEAIALQYQATIMMASTESEAELIEARGIASRALKLHRIIGFAQGTHETEMVLGEIAYRLGAFDAAQSHFESAIAKRSLEQAELFEVIAGELDANGEHDRADRLRVPITPAAASVEGSPSIGGPKVSGSVGTEV